MMELNMAEHPAITSDLGEYQHCLLEFENLKIKKKWSWLKTKLNSWAQAEYGLYRYMYFS